jgi:[ribosomal protein S5]-alanine N-acetyltransferase
VRARLRGPAAGRPTVALRRLSVRDVPALLDYHRRNREFFEPFDPVRAEDFFTEEGLRRRVADQVEIGGSLRADWVVLADDELAGRIALSNVVRGAFQSASMGYSVDRAQNGRGIATAAVGLVVAEAFGRLGLHRVEAGTLVDNIGSQRVLEKNGFVRIGVSPHYLEIAGAWRDHVLFALTREGLAGR